MKLNLNEYKNCKLYEGERKLRLMNVERTGLREMFVL